MSIEFGNRLGLTEYPIAFLLGVLLALVIWLLASGSVIIALHEGVHYAVSALEGYNPRFEWRSHLGLKNPSIVIYAESITRRENILTLITPFVLLSILCVIVMWFTSGILAATAATMFCANTVPSCADIYHTVRIARMPNGTLFANFDDDGDLRSEFAIPNSDPV